MKTLILLLFVLNAHAQQITEDPARHEIGNEGQIFSVRIDPVDRRLEVRFVDKPLVEVEPGRLVISAKAAKRGAPLENVGLVQKNNEVHLNATQLEEKNYEIKIRDKVTDKSEVIRIEAKP